MKKCADGNLDSIWPKAVEAEAEKSEDDNGHTEDHGNDFDNDPWHDHAWLFLERNQFISDESENMRSTK